MNIMNLLQPYFFLGIAFIIFYTIVRTSQLSSSQKKIMFFSSLLMVFAIQELFSLLVLPIFFIEATAENYKYLDTIYRIASSFPVHQILPIIIVAISLKQKIQKLINPSLNANYFAQSPLYISTILVLVHLYLTFFERFILKDIFILFAMIYLISPVYICYVTWQNKDNDKHKMPIGFIGIFSIILIVILLITDIYILRNRLENLPLHLINQAGATGYFYQTLDWATQNSDYVLAFSIFWLSLRIYRRS